MNCRITPSPPLELTVPDCGVRSPATSRSSVVLPAPFGPTRAATTPSPDPEGDVVQQDPAIGQRMIQMRRLHVSHRRLLFPCLADMADNSCMDPQGFNKNSRLRASDADRDRAAAVINNALAEGRLTAEEHSERLDAIYAAKTHGELVPAAGRPAGRGHGARPVPHLGWRGDAGWPGRPDRGDLRWRKSQGSVASRAEYARS